MRSRSGPGEVLGEPTFESTSQNLDLASSSLKPCSWKYLVIVSATPCTIAHACSVEGFEAEADYATHNARRSRAEEQDLLVLEGDPVQVERADRSGEDNGTGALNVV